MVRKGLGTALAAMADDDDDTLKKLGEGVEQEKNHSCRTNDIAGVDFVPYLCVRPSDENNPLLL